MAKIIGTHHKSENKGMAKIIGTNRKSENRQRYGYNNRDKM